MQYDHALPSRQRSWERKTAEQMARHNKPAQVGQSQLATRARRGARGGQKYWHPPLENASSKTESSLK